jgi:hypothetical protein
MGGYTALLILAFGRGKRSIGEWMRKASSTRSKWVLEYRSLSHQRTYPKDKPQAKEEMTRKV